MVNIRQGTILKILLFIIISITVYAVLPPLFWSLIPDFTFFKGAAKGGMVAVIFLLFLSNYFLKSDHYCPVKIN